MNTENFQKLVQLITGREMIINTKDTELSFEKDYQIYRSLPLIGGSSSFNWKTPKSDEKMLRSFITSFTSKYREPNPLSYNYVYGGVQYTWDEKTEIQKEQCNYHHASHMLSKEDLLKEIENNFSKESISQGLIRYGFYPTEYGIGIFCFWMTEQVVKAVTSMKTHLNAISIPFTNEFSDAKWVYRFKIGISKEAHNNLLQEFN